MKNENHIEIGQSLLDLSNEFVSFLENIIVDDKDECTATKLKQKFHHHNRWGNYHRALKTAYQSCLSSCEGDVRVIFFNCSGIVLLSIHAVRISVQSIFFLEVMWNGRQ